MTEDQLLQGVTEALDLGGWYWWHNRRSDLALWQGRRGWPDVTAIRGDRMLLLELKTATGLVSPEQGEWISRANLVPGITARVIRPDDYDALIAEVTEPRLLAVGGRRA